AGLQLQGIQLGDLVTQRFEFGVAIACLGFNLQCAVQELEPDAMSNSDLAGRLLEAAESIQQLALRGRPGERLKFVLPVDVDQDVARFAQQLYRHGLAVQIRAGATVARDHAADRKLLGSVDGLFLQPALQLPRAFAQIEGPDDLGSLGAMAYHLGARAPPGQQLQRIHQNGLARASLAGQHRQSGPQFQLDAIDDREVPDLQIVEHVMDLSVRSCRGPNAAWSAAGGSSRNRPGAAASRARRRPGWPAGPRAQTPRARFRRM